MNEERDEIWTEAQELLAQPTTPMTVSKTPKLPKFSFENGELDLWEIPDAVKEITDGFVIHLLVLLIFEGRSRGQNSPKIMNCLKEQ
jgi:hypothetical protein